MNNNKYETGFKRLLAAILDGVVFLPLILVEKWLYSTTSSISVLFIWATFIGFAPLLYSIILHYKYGQTYGKWVTGIQVVDISESRKLTLTQAIYRDIFYVVVAISSFVYYSFLLIRKEYPENIINDYVGFGNSIVFWWTVIELITMLTNSKRRALHDFIAKSIIIRTKITP